LLKELASQLDALVWRNQLDESGALGRFLASLLRYAYAIARDILQGQLTLRAMSLVYTTLLSVVPLLAFSFALLKGFGVFERYIGYLNDLMAPFGEQGAALTSRVLTLVDNVRGPVLLGFGFVIFLYTAISTVQKVEASLNYVWYVTKPRSFARRFSDYLVVLMFGPLIMLTALTMLTSLQSTAAVQYLMQIELLGPLFVQAGKTVPYLIISAAFTFLYMFMPNTRVRFTSALVGGIAGGCIWAAIGAIFASFVVGSTRTEAIYAAFAIGIVTLIWLYLSWLVLLVGAQIAFYHQRPAYLRIGRVEPRLSNAMRERVALNIMAMVGDAYRDPNRSITLEEIGAKLDVPTIALDPVVSALIDRGLLISTESEELLPGCDQTRMSLLDILRVARGIGESRAYREPSWSPGIDALGDGLDRALAAHLGDTTLAELVDLLAASGVATGRRGRAAQTEGDTTTS